MPGLVFDKYEVIEHLAAGGMGEVLLARQVGGVEGFERLVILKTLLPALAQDPTFVDQFVDEARVVATLSHPNVVSVFEVGVWDGSYYLAMEYIPGPNLSQLKAAARKVGRTVPLPLCAQIACEAALGLEHAHSAKDLRGGRLGVVHRDVSPQNIMVRRDGVTKVVDFGIARASNRAHRTEAGLVKGKLGYMPPEQLRGKDLDGRADQFSLGVTLWELCTGRPLFARDTDAEMMRAVLTGPIPRPSAQQPDFPPALEDVVMRMLERDPDKRFPRLYDVAQQLSAWLRESAEPHDHEAVAAFIREVDAFPDHKTPPVPAPENFVVAFKGAKGPQTTRAAPRTPEVPATRRATPKTPPPEPERKPVLAFLALGVAVLLAGAGGVWVLGPRLFPPDVGPAPQPVTVVVAPPPVKEEEPPPVKEEEPPPVKEEETPVEPPPVVVGRPKNTNPKKHEPPPAPAGEGQLVLRTTPWTLVFVDGKKLGTTPLMQTLSASPHTLQLVNREKGIDETRQISVAANETLKLDLNLEK